MKIEPVLTKPWYIKDGVLVSSLVLSQLVEQYITMMFNKTLRMFEYKNLPNEMTTKDMEKFTQMRGKTFFLKYGDRFYILEGAFKENVTWNKEPSKALIVNPALPKLKTEYTLDVDAVLYPNDSLYYGLYSLFESNAVQMANTDISINVASFNSRLKTLFTADDDNTKASLDKLLQDVYEGKVLTAVASKSLYKDSIKGVTYNTGTTSDIKDLIELKQYIKANWYIDLGINANYNMKREAINEGETQMNDDALLPLVDDMLKCRQDALAKINKIFNLNISVDLSSSWKKLREELKLEREVLENEVEGGNEDEAERDNTKSE